jgi:hypothetical protein
MTRSGHRRLKKDPDRHAGRQAAVAWREARTLYFRYRGEKNVLDKKS